MTQSTDMGRCDQCGAPATSMVRDAQRIDEPGAQWMTWKPHGEIRRGCDAHPVHSVAYDQDGRIAGRFTDGNGRGIP